jgi:hypothetical protein
MLSVFKVEALELRELELPRFSYGPFILFESLPWLLVATTLRFVSFDKQLPFQVLSSILESFAIFLAFLVAARRVLEITDIKTRLEFLSFAKQFNLAQLVVGRIFVLLFAVCAVVFVLGAYETAPFLLLGLDGIAFDQVTRAGMVWSSVLAAIIFLMVKNIEESKSSTIVNALKELARRALWMVPAIIVVAIVQFGLNYIQGLVRGLVYMYGQTSASQHAKNFVFFVFVFAFASGRLWLTLAILGLGLRESYRRGRSRGNEDVRSENLT